MKIFLRTSFLLLFVFVLTISFPQSVLGKENETTYQNVEQELNDTIDQQLDKIDWESLEEFLQSDENQSFFGQSLIQVAKDILNGNFNIDAKSFFDFVLNLLLSGFKDLLPILSSVAIMCILSGIVSKTKSNLLNDSMGTLINFFFFSTVILILLGSVWQLLSSAKKVISSIKTLSNVITPVLLTLMTATGAKVSTKVYSPAITLLSEGVIEIVSGIVLPTFIFCVVFCIVSNLSQEIKLKQLSSFFKNLSTWVLGITFTIFTGFLAIQGLTAATIDGVSIRAAKFATKTYIPILGGYLADGFDVILTSCILIKNSFGLISLLLLLSIVLFPIIKIIVFNVGLNLISAITEPIADKTIINFLVDLRKSLSILLVSVIAVSFMLFILIMMIIFSANVF